MIVTTAGLQQ